MLEYITLPNNLLPPVAPYSHAVRAGELLFVTGQLAEDPATGEINLGTVEEQTHRVMENLRIVLEHAGTSFDRVVMVRIFVTEFKYFETVNKIYASYFKAERLPCRTTIGVVELAGLGDIEIDLIVYCGD